LTKDVKEATIISNEGGSLPWEDSEEIQTKEEERYERAQERRGGCVVGRERNKIK
jgi:hypothetical protein